MIKHKDTEKGLELALLDRKQLKVNCVYFPIGGVYVPPNICNYFII